MKIRLKLKDKYQVKNTLSSISEINEVSPLNDPISIPKPESPIIHETISEKSPLHKSEPLIIDNLLPIHESEPLSNPSNKEQSTNHTSSPKPDSSIIVGPKININIDTEPNNSSITINSISIIEPTIHNDSVTPINDLLSNIDTNPINPELVPSVESEHITELVSPTTIAKPETNMEKIIRFQKLPNYKQKSKAWLEQRDNYLTASTIAAAVGVLGPVARTNLLLNKVSHGTVNNFNGNTATHWGNKYEPVANGVYAHRNNIKIYSFGMVTNTQYPILGVSPDGITEQTMIEIKCPWSRVIDGKIKTEYFHQMQEQMVVCEFDKCDFLECRFEEVSEMCFWDDFYYYNNEENINHEKGIIIVYINLMEEEIEYLYSPIDYYTNIDLMRNWRQKTIDELRHNDKTLYLFDSYWYLVKYNCQTVHRDPYWIKEYYPVLQAFWKEVEYYRDKGIDCLMEKINKEKISKEKEAETPQITQFFNSKDNTLTTLTRKKKTKCLL